MQYEKLIEKAIAAKKLAYTPYSGFKVGAALLAESGEVFIGCNIENAAYSPTNCAERTAFFTAVANGVMKFSAVAIVGGMGDDLGKNCFPCGVCRQVMMEFCTPNFKIIIAQSPTNYTIYTLLDLLPNGFGSTNLSYNKQH
ncbi:MAG: cytidine deaminase [Defluviitaleaceae bacterium]|nr:cytidine deaminase [Defluviitaleaceae bacterium]